MRSTSKFVLPALATAVLLAACGSSSSNSSSAANSGSGSSQSAASGSAVVVKTANNAKLGTVLVDGKGMTLYRLSGEHGGKLICTTTGCLKLWHPLVASGATMPSGGVASLGVIKRAGGVEQVAYKGEPLYTFAQDTGPGTANGQGFKDVGTWNAVTTKAASSSAPAAPASSSSSSSGGGYGY
jgi:predicted lipoprotein with Yx(FWY)xxD motif